MKSFLAHTGALQVRLLLLLLLLLLLPVNLTCTSSFCADHVFI